MLFVACDVPHDTTQVRSRRSARLSQDLGRQSTTQSEFKWFCFYSPKVSELFNYAYFCWSFCRCLGVRWPWSVQVCADIGESVLSGGLGATHGTAFLPSLSWSRSSRYTSIVIRDPGSLSGYKGDEKPCTYKRCIHQDQDCVGNKSVRVRILRVKSSMPN